MSKIAISAFCAGVVCKMHDDLVDNPKLQKYKTEFLLELLKGLHYILFTFVSIKDPIFFITLCLTCVMYMISDKKAFHNPYEHSVLYSFLILFALIEYKYFTLLNCYKLLPMTIIIIVCAFFELNINKEEYSFLKLIIRMNGLMFFLIVLYFNSSVLVKNYSIYCIGYAGVSIITQSYSLFSKNKKKNIKHRKKNIKNRKNLKKETYKIINKIIRKYTSNIIKYVCPPIILDLIHTLDKIQEIKYY
jgi:hypothetical protein